LLPNRLTASQRRSALCIACSAGTVGWALNEMTVHDAGAVGWALNEMTVHDAGAVGWALNKLTVDLRILRRTGRCRPVQVDRFARFP